MTDSAWLIPDWPAPRRVQSLITTRDGGVSGGSFASLNLGLHVGDDPEDVSANRARFELAIGGRPLWLDQVHGTRVVDAGAPGARGSTQEADASYSREVGVACVVMTADCLPVLFCDDAACVVAAAHAGWRGLLAGVLERTVEAMGVPTTSLMAFLGPAIGPGAFEVGDEVRTAFAASHPDALAAFTPAPKPGKWFADIYQLARQRLAAEGVVNVFGGKSCTFSETTRFFSYRRDGQTGRMASAIWLAPA